MVVQSDQAGEKRSGENSSSCDVLVIGSGAAGLMAALSARFSGAKTVIMLEKEALLGGTSACSGGWLWVPGNPVARREGVEDSLTLAREYLQHEAGEYFDAERVDSFLATGPEMVDFCEKQTRVRFLAAPAFPDYHPTAPGSAMGRSICSQPFDARQLGESIAYLRRPLRALTFLGMAVSSGAELRHFMNVTRSLSSALFVARRLTGHLFDLVWHRRGMRLTNGNALIASLLASALDAGVQVRRKAGVIELIHENGAVVGALVEYEGRRLVMRAQRGVILATGGFAHDPDRRSEMFAHHGRSEVWSLPPEGNTGDGLRMAETVGGKVVNRISQPAAWAPTSVVSWPDGERGGYIHVIDRAKPGVIAVTRSGNRFVNEACSYHDFVTAMMQACGDQLPVEAFLVCDHAALRRYGLGFVKPFPLPIAPHLKSGYLLRGRNIKELAEKAGIDVAVLAETIASFNADVHAGCDRQYGKGSGSYDRYMGDPDADGNPCLAPVNKGPFYAVRVIPGCLTTYAGLSTDSSARVLNSAGRPIKGLYAVGSDMLTIAGGGYLAAGANLGPAMTFGYIAGRALGKATKNNTFVNF